MRASTVVYIIFAVLMFAAVYGQQGASQAPVIVFWVGTALFVVYRVMTKRQAEQAASRPCPRCGHRVAVGKLDCPHCGFDFRTIGQAAVTPDR